MTMKLSDAIRLGAMIRPQARGALRSRRWFGLFGEVTTCALGAAFEAGNIGSRTIISTGTSEHFRGRVISKAGAVINVLEIPDDWNLLLWRTVNCPTCTREPETVQRTIAHLNDGHRWTREQIADWIATIEPVDPLPPRDWPITVVIIGEPAPTAEYTGRVTK